MRRKAKVINFGILYGLGVNLCKQIWVLTREKQLKEFYNAYFSKFAGLAKYLDKTKLEAEKMAILKLFWQTQIFLKGLNQISHI